MTENLWRIAPHEAHGKKSQIDKKRMNHYEQISYMHWNLIDNHKILTWLKKQGYKRIVSRRQNIQNDHFRYVHDSPALKAILVIAYTPCTPYIHAHNMAT